MSSEEFKAENIKARLAEVSAAVTAAHQALDDGKTSNLDGLEADVDIICREIVDLPSDEGRNLRSRMLALIDGLNQFLAELEQSHCQTKAALNKLSDGQRAHTAYRGNGER